MVYTIGEMAKLAGVAPSTLRYYDKEQLLPFTQRSSGGRRIFKDSDYETLKIIHCLKSSGMQIKDIREFTRLASEGDKTIDARLELFEKRRDEIILQMQQLKETLDTVNYKCWYYETAKKAGTTAIPDNMTDDELPEDMRKIRKKLKTMQNNGDSED